MVRNACQRAGVEHVGAECLTIDLALAWALEREVPPGSVVRPMRILVVRGFARYMAGIDPRTEIPPTGLIPFRRRRRAPFIYSDANISALREAGRPERRSSAPARLRHRR